MPTRLYHLRTIPLAWLACAVVCGSSLATEPSDWSGFVAAAQISPSGESIPPADAARPSLVMPPAQVAPPSELVVVPPAEEVLPPTTRTPLLDDGAPHEELLPQVIGGEMYGPRGVRPYGGGHPTDWWGCGGSPYRTGPGLCDNWKVGPRWHVTVDGWVMARPDADLTALADTPFAPGIHQPPLIPQRTEQFDHAPGGRITFISQVPKYVGYQIQAVYEGVEEWNASVVFPKQPLALPVPPPPFVPPHPLDPFATEQRSLHYRSNLHSGELNWVHESYPDFRPFCGARYLRFNEKINDLINQEAPPPLPGDPPDPPVITTDRLNHFDIDNHLMGFQIGTLFDVWHVNDRFSLVGFLNTGLYYNRIKFANLMGVFTTQEIADDLGTPENEARTDFSTAVNHDVSRHSEIATVSEASLTAVCRLNKCWALRSGYQVLWINNVHLAEDAFLFGETDGRSLFFHGWHAGIECRR